MINLRKSKEDEIPCFVVSENLVGTSDFIIPYSEEQHRDEMRKPNIIYLSITEEENLLGFIILSVDADSKSIEFRRIVVASKGHGTGQAAIEEMERYCKHNLNCDRIWLDVFEFNNRGQHIYKKLGYKKYKSGMYNGKALLYFEKGL